MAAAAQRNVGTLLRRLRNGRFAAVFGLAVVLFVLSGTPFFLNL